MPRVQTASGTPNSYWFPGPWTRVTSVVSLTTATTAAATAAMFPNQNF